MAYRRYTGRMTAEIPVWCLYVCPECRKGTVAPSAYTANVWYEYDSSTSLRQLQKLRAEANGQLKYEVEHELRIMDSGFERVGDKLEVMKCICPLCGHYGFTQRGQKGLFGRYRFLSRRKAGKVLEAAYKSPILISRNIQALKKAAMNYEAYRSVDWNYIAARCENDGHCKTDADAIMEQAR